MRPKKPLKKRCHVGYKVPRSSHQTRVDRFINELYPTLTKKAFVKMIDKKEILLLKREEFERVPYIVTQSDDVIHSSVMSPTKRSSFVSFQDPQRDHALHPIIFVHDSDFEPPLLHDDDDQNDVHTDQQFRTIAPPQEPHNLSLRRPKIKESQRVEFGDVVLTPLWLGKLSPHPLIQRSLNYVLADDHGESTPHMAPLSPPGDVVPSHREQHLPSHTFNAAYSTPDGHGSAGADAARVDQLQFDSKRMNDIHQQHQQLDNGLPSPSSLSNSASNLSGPAFTHSSSNFEHLQHQRSLDLIRSFAIPPPLVDKFTDYLDESIVNYHHHHSTDMAKNGDGDGPVNLSHPLPSGHTPPPPKLSLWTALAETKRLQAITLYSDPYFLCIDKPYGVSVHASDHQVHKRQQQRHMKKPLLRSPDDLDAMHAHAGESLDLGGNHQETPREFHIDSWLSSAHQLSLHYLQFSALVRRVHDLSSSIPRSTGHASSQEQTMAMDIDIPYSLPELKQLHSLANEVQQSYATLAKHLQQPLKEASHVDDSNEISESSEDNNIGISLHHDEIISPNLAQFLTIEPMRLVHRLDRATTGALLVAKSRLTAKALGETFNSLSKNTIHLGRTDDKKTAASQQLNQQPTQEQHAYHTLLTLQKIYLAVVHSTPRLLHHLHSTSQHHPSENQINYSSSSTVSIDSPYADLFPPDIYPPLIQRDIHQRRRSPHSHVLHPHQQHPLVSGHSITALTYPTAPYLSLGATSKAKYVPSSQFDSHAKLSRHQARSMSPWGDKVISRSQYQQSVSIIRPLAHNNRFTLLAMSPLTGHQHQLRVHAAADIGLQAPIVGDDKYTSPAVYNSQHILSEQELSRLSDRIAASLEAIPPSANKLQLSCHSLSLPHPLFLHQGKKQRNPPPTTATVGRETDENQTGMESVESDSTKSDHHPLSVPTRSTFIPYDPVEWALATRYLNLLHAHSKSLQFIPFQHSRSQSVNPSPLHSPTTTGTPSHVLVPGLLSITASIPPHMATLLKDQFPSIRM